MSPWVLAEMIGSLRKHGRPPGRWHISMQAIHSQLLKDLMEADTLQDMPSQWHELSPCTSNSNDHVQQGQRTWQQQLAYFQHTLSSKPAAGTDSSSWQLADSWWGIASSAQRLWTLEAATLQQQHVCLQAVPPHLHPAMAPVLEEASAALLPRTYLQLVGQALLAAAAGMLPIILQGAEMEEGQLQHVVCGLFCHPFAAAVQEAVAWLTTSALTTQCSEDPSPLLPLVDPSTTPGATPLRHSFRKPYRPLPSVGTGMWALGGATSSLTGPGSLTASLQQLEEDVAGFRTGLAALAGACEAPQGSTAAAAGSMLATCLEEQLAAAWAAAGPGLDALLDGVLMAEVQLLLSQAAAQTPEGAWATAVAPSPDLLALHPAAAMAAMQCCGAPPTAQGSQAEDPLRCAAQEVSWSRAATANLEAMQQQWGRASGSRTAGDKLLAGAADTAAAAAAGALAALGDPQRVATSRWVPLRVGSCTARLLVLVRSLLLKVALLPGPLRGGLLVTLLRAVLRLLASLLDGVQGCGAAATSGTPAAGAAAAGTGGKEGPAATALALCDALLAGGLLSRACWPPPAQLGVEGPQEVALVADLLAEARGQAAALVRVLAQVLVGGQLELLLGCISPGLTVGMAWSSPRCHLGSGGAGPSAPLRLWVLLQQRWQASVALTCPSGLAVNLLRLGASTSTQWLVDLYRGLAPCATATPQLVVDATLLIQVTQAADQQVLALRRRAAAAAAARGSSGGVGGSGVWASCRQVSCAGGGPVEAATVKNDDNGDDDEGGGSITGELSQACRELWSHIHHHMQARQLVSGVGAGLPHGSTAAAAGQGADGHGPLRPGSSPEARPHGPWSAEVSSGTDRVGPWAWLPSVLQPPPALLLGPSWTEPPLPGSSLAPLPLQLPPLSLPPGCSTGSVLLVSH